MTTKVIIKTTHTHRSLTTTYAQARTKLPDNTLHHGACTCPGTTVITLYCIVG